MKYSEAKKQIEALSSKYDANLEDGDFYVVYNKNIHGIYVGGSHEYVLDIGCVDTFSSMPYCNKLYMILTKLAITPLDERKEEKRQYVKIYDSAVGYLNINILTHKMIIDSKIDMDGMKAKFTDKDIEQLKKRGDIPLDWNKVHFEDVE